MLGAGLYAANLSTTFKLRKFRMSDGATYPVVFQVRIVHRSRLTLRWTKTPPWHRKTSNESHASALRMPWSSQATRYQPCMRSMHL